MRKSKYREEQIAYALRQAEGGTRVSEICMKLRMSSIHILMSRKAGLKT